MATGKLASIRAIDWDDIKGGGSMDERKVLIKAKSTKLEGGLKESPLLLGL